MELNKCFLGGRLVRDPETQYLPSGKAVTGFTIAINRKWQTEGGEKKEDVAYLDCKAFGRTAENITQYFKKGSNILVEARATTEAWEDKVTKAKRSAIKFVVENFHFVGGRNSDSDAPPQARQAPPQTRPTAAAAGSESGPASDQYPF